MFQSDNLLMKSLILIVFCVGFFAISLAAQEAIEILIPSQERVSIAPENPEALPRQFRELGLGMGLDDLKEALIQDELFTFRGDRDVSFLPILEQTLVESTGFSFIRRAFFQLVEGSVFVMSFTLDTRLLDHYSVYTSLVRRYGEPQSINPQEAIWESDTTRLSIERPLTLKYLDRQVFDNLIDESRTQDSRQILMREEFLRGL